MTTPSSLLPNPGALWPPPRTDRSRPVVAGEIHRGHHVRDLLGPDDRPRPPVEHAVVDRPGLVVTGVIGRDDRAPDLLTQLIDPHRYHRSQVVSPDAVNPLVPRTVCPAWTRPSSLVRELLSSIE